MTINYTTLLSLAEPVTGTQSATWGDDVNQGLTDYLDIAIAGAQVISGSQTAVTLSKTTGSYLGNNIAQVGGAGTTGTAQYAVINCTGNPASILTITAPANSKTYVVINSTSTNQSVKLVGPGPTTGVTVAATQAALIAWGGADFALIATTDASKLTGTLGVGNGGTGQTTAQAAINALAGAVTSGSYLRGNGTNVAMSAIQAADLPTATDSANGAIKLGSGTAQTVAANSVTATASRSYALQLNGSGQGIVNVPWTDTVYSLPAATDTVLGGIKLGDATQQTTAANAVSTTASRTYALQVNASGQGVINVPWTDTSSTAPGGSTTQVQYNNAGTFGGSANFTFDGSTVTTANDASISGVKVGKGAGAFTSNTVVGLQTLELNTAGIRNTAVGRQASQHVKGDANTAVGAFALQGNFANATGVANVGIGALALNSFTTATNNIAIGDSAMYGVLTANECVGIGTTALSIASGNRNVAIGYESGKDMTTGGKNTIIGSYTGNDGVLDIRASSNYIVLSDGDANVRAYWNGANATFAGGLNLGGLLRTVASSFSGSGTVTPTSDTCNQFNVGISGGDISFAAPSGSPLNSQKLLIRIFGDSVSRNITSWNAIYRVIGTTLPTTAAANKTIYIGCVYNNTYSKWDVVGVTIEA